MDIAQHQRHGFFFSTIVAWRLCRVLACAVPRRRAAICRLRRKVAFKAHDAEVSPACGKIGFRHLAKCKRRTHVNIIECVVERFVYGFALSKSTLVWLSKSRKSRAACY